MARAVYDFQSPNRRTAIGKSCEAVSREIMQFDDAMLESKLDAMIRTKVENVANAMPDASDRRDHGRREIRTNRRTQGVPCRPLRTQPDRQGQQVGAEGAETEGRGLRVRGHRTLPAQGAERRGVPDRHVPGRRVDDTGQLPWGDRMPSQTLSDKLKRVYAEIDEWRNRPLGSEYPYVFMDGVWHKRSWGGSVENVGILVAIGVDSEVIGVTEGMKEDRASWEQFVRGMIERGLKGVRLVVGDRCAGLVATVNSMLPDAGYQRCTVHFMRNVLSKTPPGHREWVSAALKAVFAMESRESALAKAETVATEMDQGGGQLPQGGHRGDDDLPAARVSRGAPQAHPHEQHDRTAQPRDQTSHARRGKLPGREQRAHARLRAHQARHRERMVDPPLSGHVPAR